MFDFSSIKSIDAGGPRNSFEELMCQIAQLEKIPDANIFRRVEGAGGDGGLEAYWILENGEKIGYQAKYFLRSGGIDWTQINGSIQEAFSCHPELTKYVIAVACDLTDVTGKRGTSGWEHWATWSRKWADTYKKPSGEPVEFEIWTSSELSSRLIQPECAGIVKYFFEKTSLTPEWFGTKLEESIIALDERFTPQYHVKVEIEMVFQALLRSKDFFNQLYDFKEKIENWEFPNQILSKVKNFTFDNELINKLAQRKRDFLQIFDEINISDYNQWDINKWSDLTSSFLHLTVQLENIFGYNHKHESYYSLRKISQSLSFLEGILNDFKGLINNKYFKCVNSNIALIYGSAGAGKSHLLAQGTSNALKENHPAILLLGQNFNNETVGIQISKILELSDYTLDDFLSAFDVAGKVNRRKSLIVIDAINEGAGCRFWSNNLANFLSKLNKYKNLCCIISCRKEYFHLAISENLRGQYPSFEIKGFSTYEEQMNAAKIYLDKFNIARPSTPWLAPEFVNPLFLKSLCISLKQNNQTEIPTGLQGSSKLLRFYLESIAKYVAHKESITTNLWPLFGKTLKNLAGQMFLMRRDYLSINECHALINQNFNHIILRTESSWLDVFLNNGLLRNDPNPDKVDEFDNEHVIRFTFQRFQDHFMAEKFLEDLANPYKIFELSQNQFLFENGVINWNWRGLFSALAFILPEKHKIELVDILPASLNSNWWEEWEIQEYFVESIQWRSRDAFFDRSRELLNELTYYDPIDVVIKISTSIHPWNAEFLNSKLLPLNMPERDAWWSVWVNQQSNESDSTIGILLEWCLKGQQNGIKTVNQYFASIVLCWFFSSSNRSIRDNATKSLTQLLRTNPDIFPRLLDNFIKVDDLYILERLLAAAYGACCIDTDTNVISQYSRKIFDLIFIHNAPPYGTLLRDYALGIIELGNYLGCLENEIDLKIARPPYKSPKPNFNITKNKIERLAKYAGSDEIYWSAAQSMGDFANYEIWPRVREFIKVPLNKKVSLTNRQKISNFSNTIDNLGGKILKEFKELERILNPYTYGITSYDDFLTGFKSPSDKEVEQWEIAKERQKDKFLKLLDPQLKTEALEIVSLLFSDDRYPLQERGFDKNLVCNWVAYRAYRYGWTTKLFPHDRSLGDSSRQRALTERIGKKYQWLALEELLSRLADNFWISEDYSESIPRVYVNPLSLGFQRDIDPTILFNFKSIDSRKIENITEFSPYITLEDTDEEDLLEFPFKKDLTLNINKLPIRHSEDGEKWLVLYEHQSVKEKYPEGMGDHGLRREEFRFLITVFAKKSHASSVANFIINKGVNGIDAYLPDITDQGYFFENPWRNTWDQNQFETSSWNVPDKTSFSRCVNNFIWESHLDASLPDGVNSNVPTPWLIKELNLSFNKETLTWQDIQGNVVIKNIYLDGNNCTLLNYKAVEKILLDTDLTFLSVYIAERSAWLNGNNNNVSWVRAEGVCWKSGNRIIPKAKMAQEQRKSNTNTT
ncbi:hypothetical protein JW980_09785 [Acinetobacter johnsonii]|uniref:hypothetical protein n=1 Tax=Acinetobacter johnsonii TaxID=40214 RepID=UPI00196A8FB4|nr:hypothetical protein [Acinetobacter johnsonii]QSE44609.1 hypothetical protein JW980_09785 [Acinetobacter johnsonii]